MAEKIDLNQADVAALASLPGIGKGLAARIVDYRETVHPFAEVIELAAVPGISERMVREIEEQLTVGAVEELEIMADEIVEPNETIEEDEETAISTAVETAVEAGVEAEPEIVWEIVEEETEVDEPLTERPIPSSPPAPARSGFGGQLFTAVAGALLGALLTLTVLWLLNGSLRLNESAQVDLLRQQSVETAVTMEAEQAGARSDLDTLNERLVAMATRESDTAVLLETIQTDQANTQDSLADTADKTAVLETAAAERDERLTAVAANVAALETVTTALDERLTAVAASAENFDAFLNGLRDMLWTLQGPPPTPTATVTPTATLAATTTVTPTLSATATPYATRTPRPTATPLGEAEPTATPTE